MKKCWKCEIEKELDDFYKDSRQKDGKQKACKECQKKRNIEYNKSHQQYFKLKGKEKYQQDKDSDPEFNKKRYQSKKQNFLDRRRRYSASIQGKLKQLLSSARGRAKAKQADFDIDIEFMYELFNKNNGRCALTNIEFTYTAGTGEGANRNYHPFNPSLDKIDPNGSYTRDNVRIVLVAVNIALNAFGEDVLEKISTEFLKKRGFILDKINT